MLLPNAPNVIATFTAIYHWAYRESHLKVARIPIRIRIVSVTASSWIDVVASFTMTSEHVGISLHLPEPDRRFMLDVRAPQLKCCLPIYGDMRAVLSSHALPVPAAKGCIAKEIGAALSLCLVHFM